MLHYFNMWTALWMWLIFSASCSLHKAAAVSGDGSFFFIYAFILHLISLLLVSVAHSERIFFFFDVLFELFSKHEEETVSGLSHRMSVSGLVDGCTWAIFSDPVISPGTRDAAAFCESRMTLIEVSYVIDLVYFSSRYMHCHLSSFPLSSFFLVICKFVTLECFILSNNFNFSQR